MRLKYIKLIYILLVIGLSACGGGGGDSTPPVDAPVDPAPEPASPPVTSMVTLSGVAQKGPFTSLTVTAFPVVNTTALRGVAIPAKITDSSYTVDVPVNTPVLLEATGTFTDELTARNVELKVPLTSLVPVADTAATTNINVLTDFSAKKAFASFAANTAGGSATSATITDAVAASDRFVLDAFGITGTASPASLSFDKINASTTITDPNMQLLLLSAMLLLDQPETAPLERFATMADLFTSDNPLVGVRASLGFFNGSSAPALYDQIRASNSIPGLPSLTFTDTPGWICTAESICGWVVLPEKTLAISSNVIYEADGEVELVVRLSEISVADTVFTLRSTDGTALAQDDYIAIDKDYTIAAGEQELRITIPVVVDNEDESQEHFSVTLTPVTAGYTLFNGISTVDIQILDGSPALGDTVTSDIVINNFCIRGLDSPGINTAADCSVPLPATVAVMADDSALAVELDLRADCADPLVCDALSQDRLVEFYLQAVDATGIPQLENRLGEYRYPQPDIQLPGDAAISNLFYLAIDDAASADLMLQARASGWQLRLDARVKREGATMAITIADLIPVPGQLLAGSRSVGITGTVSVIDGAAFGCQPGHYALTADFEISLGESTNGTVCVDLSSTGDGLVAHLTDNTLPDMNLDIRSVKFALPAGHVTLAALGDGIPVQAGLGEATFFPVTLSDGSPSPLRSWLHAEGLPFSYRTTSVLLTSTGIKIGYDKLHYVMGVPYSDSDPRNVSGSASAADKALKGIKSNDIPYSAVIDQSGTIILEESGINASVQVAVGLGSSAYPKVDIAWSGFSQSVKNGRITNKVEIESAIAIKQSTACKEAGCRKEKITKYQVLADASNPATSTALDTRGAIVGTVATTGGIIDDTVTVLDIVPSWGVQSDTVYAYQRPMDLPVGSLMSVFIPGYRFPMAEKQLVSDFLLAHAKADPSSQTHQLFEVGTDDFIRGNYYPSGLSLGPEIYSNELGVPVVISGSDLSGKPLRIDNQSDVISLNTSVATKYVVRNDGITGVFNIAASSLNNPVSIYGYDFALDRFAIRLVGNRIDTYNWIDGHLQVPGDAGLDVYFTNLQIDCGARLAQGNLSYEYCDEVDNNGNGIIDENCNQRLASWAADAEVFSMAFVNTGGSETSACQLPGPQVLSLRHEVEMEALDKPVGLLARWSPAGELVGQDLSLQDSYRFDAQKGSRESGFPIQVSSGEFGVFNATASDRYGWFGLQSAKISVPFWLALDSDIRVANALKLGEPVAEASVAAKAGTFTANTAILDQVNKTLQQSFIDDNSAHLQAEYRWGNTGVGFALPVYFAPASFNDDRQTRFIGRKLDIDLFVLSAGAGIDLIEPAKTKLSFGASANIKKLQSIRFQVDLDDPENLVKVDDFLQSVGLSDKPVLAPAFSELQQHVNIVNKFANQGVELVIEQGIDSSVDLLAQTAAATNGKDPFVALSESLAQINNMPQQVNILLNDEINRPISEILQAVENELLEPLQNIHASVITINIGAGLPPETERLISDTRNSITLVTDRARQLSTVIAARIRQSQSFIGQINRPVAEFSDAVGRVSFILQQATTVVADECLAGAISNPERSGYLKKFDINMASINKILKLFEAGDILVPLLDLIADDPALAQQLATSSRAIKRRAEVIAGQVALAETAIRNQICGGDITALLNDVNVLLSGLNSTVSSIKGELLALNSQLADWSALQGSLVDSVVKPLEDVDNKLALLVAELNKNKSGIKALELADLPALSTDMTFLITSIRSNAESKIQTITGDAVTQLTTLLDRELPGAYFTPEQLRQMLVKQMMTSPPVVNLRVALNKYMTEVNKQLNDLVLEATDQINTVVKASLSQVENSVNDVLAAATAPIKKIPLTSASLDGYGIIAGDELERFHIGAEWTMSPNQEGKPGDTFAAALDVTSQSRNNNAAGCSIPAGKALLEAEISAYNLGGNIAGSSITFSELSLGFTLETGGGSVIPKGIEGGLYIIGDIGFSEFVIIDPGFIAGIGSRETYIGARANALFSEVEAEVAFMAGKTCDNTLLLELDPVVAQFIDIPATGFSGAYARGGLSVPIWTTGCALTVGVSADFGGWALAGPPLLVGGLVGGGAYGEALCIASIKGKITTILQSRGGDISFIGNGFGIAGAGFCEKETWTTVSRSRDDSWCATGDAQFGAKYDNGWSIYQLETSAFH